MDKLKKLICRYRDAILYMVFGSITTLVDFTISFVVYAWTDIAVLSNAVAWIGAVVVAFLTNKSLVFHSKDWSLRTTVPEFFLFAMGRVFSGAIQIGVLYLTVDLLGLNHTVVKLITSIFVVLFNFFISKLAFFGAKNYK